ncbi:MAG: Pseudouridine synthase [Bacteroidota bacterium]|nr:Pseudouridine synthase [Bacteroidota bacterium]
MRKKISDSTSKPEKKTSSIPFKKPERKKTKAIVEVAKKYFAKKDKAKKFDKTDKDGKPVKGKPFKDFGGKKFYSPAIGKEDRDTVAVPEVKVSDEIRLNKYLAHSGVASRRNADELIKAGRVKVNGAVVIEMGYKVKAKDAIEFDGKRLNLEKKYYVLLNKPKDFITTVKDEKDRKTVMELLRGVYAQIDALEKPRLYPVGRLDRNTTGVLLITNDGELAQKLTHPSSEVKKVYHVVLDKKLRKEDFDKIAEGGVVLEDGIAEVDEIAYPNPKNRAEVGLEIHTGKNRFIRRLFESMEYEVEKLDRVYFAGLTKKDLPRGRWRFLTEEELRLLKHFNG